MTYSVPLGSAKHEAAVKFGRELERAMKARDVGARTISASLGGSRAALRSWRSGRNLPRIEAARRLAAVLDWPRLETLAIDLRRKACEVDGVAFVDDSGSDNRRYCSASCQRVAEKKRLGSTVDKRAALAERRLLAHQRAVDAYCNGCEPSGRCVTADCPLRPVSPLSLYESRVDLTPARSRRRNRWEGTSEADSARQTAVWARYTPEERQARIDHAAAGSKLARGLVPS